MFKEPELPSRYGEYNAAGEIVKDAQVCAVSGQRIEAGDVTIGVQNSPVFYRIKASVYRRMTREEHEALYAEIGRRASWPMGSTYDPEALAVRLAEAPLSAPAQPTSFSSFTSEETSYSGDISRKGKGITNG